MSFLFLSKFWKWKTAILSFLLVLFLSFPSFDCLVYYKQDINNTWNIVLKQSNEPFKQHWYGEPEHHNAKRTFRLLVPITIGILGITNVYIIYSILEAMKE